MLPACLPACLPVYLCVKGGQGKGTLSLLCKRRCCQHVYCIFFNPTHYMVCGKRLGSASVVSLLRWWEGRRVKLAVLETFR